MQAIYEQQFTVHYYELDQHAMVRPINLLNYMLDAAGGHARILGVSVADLQKRGLTWVLSRVHLVVDRPVRSFETVTIRTWPSLREGLFTCREFELFDGHGEIIAWATTSFAVLDMNRRRPVQLSDVLPDYPLTPVRAVDDGFASLPVLENSEYEKCFHARRGDVDINRHVNNVIYVEWAMETVPDEVFDSCFLSGLEIGYRAEALAGDKILARCAQQDLAGNTTYLHQLASDTGKEFTRLITRWKPLPVI